MNIRMAGRFAAFCSASTFCAQRTGQAMFDCPEHNQTSPIITSRMRAVCSPDDTTNSSGPPAFEAGRVVDHCPVSLALLT